MNERDIRRLMFEIHCQLDRNGFPVDFDGESYNGSQPDIDAIRSTIEREEKIYPALSFA